MCKIGWTDQQDKLLVMLKQKKFIESWCEIGQAINKNGMGKNRTGKQCRERYINHLKNEVKKEGWDHQEELNLFTFYKIHGSHWTKIALQLVGRSENFVKNKFYGSIRKVLRLINKIGKQKIKKRSKPIKYQSLLRIIEIAEQGWDLQVQIKNQGEQLRDSLFYLILHSQEENDEMIIGLIEKIHKFNMKTRCYGLKKKKCRSKLRQNEEEKRNDEEVEQRIIFSEKESCESFLDNEEQKVQVRSQQEKSVNEILWYQLNSDDLDDDLLKLPPLNNVKIKQFSELDEDLMRINGQYYEDNMI